MPDSWSAWEQTLKAPACAAEAHDECPHLSGHGGGFNPRRLHWEARALLCRCTCHSACPVTAVRERRTSPWNTWYRSCTCPGGELARRRLEEAGMDASGPGELWEKVRRQSAARFEAFRSVRDRSAGRSQEEIRQLYLAELRWTSRYTIGGNVEPGARTPRRRPDLPRQQLRKPFHGKPRTAMPVPPDHRRAGCQHVEHGLLDALHDALVERIHLPPRHEFQPA